MAEKCGNDRKFKKMSANLTVLKILKEKETFSESGDNLTWDTNGADIYYQGTTEKRTSGFRETDLLSGWKENQSFRAERKKADI